MNVGRFSVVTGATILALGALNTVWALALPPAAHPPAPGRVIVWLTLLTANGALYLLGDRLRKRAGVMPYFGVQAALVFSIAAAGARGPMSLAVFVALTAEAILLRDGNGSVWITAAAIALFVAASAVGSTLYGAAAASIVLIAVGIVAHAGAALLQLRNKRSTSATTTVAAEAPAPATALALGGGLTQREQEVLDILATGARTSDIAARLGISERTAKAHLSRIYQKLGVSSRAEAIARVAALQASER